MTRPSPPDGEREPEPEPEPDKPATNLIIFKNMFSLTLTFKAYDWIMQSGVERVFYALGSVQLAICLLRIYPCVSLFARSVVHRLKDIQDGPGLP